MRRTSAVLATSAAAAAGDRFAPNLRMLKRVRTPIDQVVMQQLDADQTQNVISCRNVAWVSWLIPVHTLQYLTHKRYEVEGVASGSVARSKLHLHELLPQFDFTNGQRPPDTKAGTGSATADDSEALHDEKLGILTLNIFDNFPKSQSFSQRLLDPAPHTTATFRIMVMDRIHWQRSSFSLGIICKSLFWGRMVHSTTDIKVDFQSKVELDAAFDAERNVYSKYVVRIPQYDFELSLADTGAGLLDAATPVVPGFLDNESALRAITLPTEVNYTGTGQVVGSVFRQPMFSHPTHPNVGEVVSMKEGSLFRKWAGCSPLGEPISVMLSENIPHVALSTLESDVEDENEPHSTSHTWHDGGIKDRVQRKTMNRYNAFRDELRGRAISDIRGEEVPR